jgi:Xaa-Pro aminopeptidase
MENYQNEVKPFWVSELNVRSSGSVDVMEKAVEYARKLNPKPQRIGAELAFLPADSSAVLGRAFPGSEIKDALFVLERLRAIKSPEELKMLHVATDAVIDSMAAVFHSYGAGATKNELAEALRREETSRGLTFDYCLIAAGSSLNRAPSDQRWEEGDVLSLDSGGNYHGYIGDVARMGIIGAPDQELEDLLAEVEAVEQASMTPIRAGALGKEIYAAANAVLHKSKIHNHTHFLAHGMGLVSHEAPRLTNSGPVPYDAYDAERPLGSGMVVSVETTLQHPHRRLSADATEHGRALPVNRVAAADDAMIPTVAMRQFVAAIGATIVNRAVSRDYEVTGAIAGPGAGVGMYSSASPRVR